MNQKKISALLLLAFCMVFITIFFTSCTKQEAEPQEKEEDITSKISTKIDAYTTDLADTSDSIQSDEAILKYLSDWADAKKIDHRSDSSGNLIFTKSAASGYEAVEPTVLICPCDHKQYQQCIAPIAMSQYLIKNATDAGNLTIIYTPSEGDRYEALSKVDKSALPDNARILTLSPGAKGVFATSSSAGSTYSFKMKGAKVRPQLNVAYRINVTGLPSGLPDARINDVPNPIEEMEHVLTWLNNKKNAFELISLQGGIDQAMYAPSATMEITIDANDEEEFVEKMDSSIEEWTRSYGKKYPDATYSYNKIETPKKVYDQETTLKLVSFVYTLLNGEYYRDDDGNLISICSLTWINTEKKSIRILSSGYSLDEAGLKEIDTAEMTLANLSGVAYEVIHKVPLWTGVTDSEFTKEIKAAYDKTSGKSLHYDRSVAPTCTGVLQPLTGSTDVISITVSDNIVKECTGTVLEFMASQVEEKEEE